METDAGVCAPMRVLQCVKIKNCGKVGVLMKEVVVFVKN